MKPKTPYGEDLNEWRIMNKVFKKDTLTITLKHVSSDKVKVFQINNIVSFTDNGYKDETLKSYRVTDATFGSYGYDMQLQITGLQIENYRELIIFSEKSFLNFRCLAEDISIS